ncbi:MAG: hypothetical protein IKC17_03760 [Bacteroidales bacterium]|nr:hypothetical protein [Bacteroidales bacterium]
MKKILLITFATFGILFSSCTKENNTEKSELAGTWTFTENPIEIDYQLTGESITIPYLGENGEDLTFSKEQLDMLITSTLSELTTDLNDPEFPMYFTISDNNSIEGCNLKISLDEESVYAKDNGSTITIKANYDEFFPIDITLDYIITGDNLTLSADKDMIVDMAAEFATLEAIDETDLAMYQMLITLVAQQIDSLEINFHLVRK